MNHDIQVTLRIPGSWASAAEFVESVPEEYQLNPHQLKLPDGTVFEMEMVDADDQFVSVFASACRQPPNDEEKRTIENYRVNVCLTGPGGSLAAARDMMRAGEAIVRGGGGGVFIDNSGLSFGGSRWIEITHSEDSDAISFAFVSIIGGKSDIFTMGMHVLGLPDLILRSDQVGDDGLHLIEMIRYLGDSGREIEDGHLLLDDQLNPRFRCTAETDQKSPPGSIMHNPYGRLRMRSVSEIAEMN